MVFFLAFLVFTTFVVPILTLSRLGRLAVSLTFFLTLTFGALATIWSFEIDTTLKLACLSML